MTEDLFRPIFVPNKFREAVSGRAWLGAMLEAEAALAVAEARAGLIPPDAAEAIATCCKKGREAGPEVSEEAARYVHKGATSQDIVDTAAMLLTKRALNLLLTEIDAIAAVLARLAEAHRDTPIAARTLLQQALPTTFGLKAAGWLASVLEARRRLLEVCATRLAAQMGGAAGTLASLGDSGTEVLK